MNILTTITTTGTSARSSLLVAAALTAASLGAVAQTVAPLTRAEVTAELVRARAAGEMEHHVLESLGLFWMNDIKKDQASAQPAPAEQGPSRYASSRRSGQPAQQDPSARESAPSAPLPSGDKGE